SGGCVRGAKAHRAFNQTGFRNVLERFEIRTSVAKMLFRHAGAAAAQQPLWQGILLALLAVLALLVGDAAAGLASGLARGLALAAAAVLGAVAEIAGIEGLNMFHLLNLQTGFICIYVYIIQLQRRKSKKESRLMQIGRASCRER